MVIIVVMGSQERVCIRQSDWGRARRVRYNNFHKHTMYSNLRSLDCVSKPIDYINRAKELNHTTYFTTEHGYQGNIFEAHTLCQENGLKCIYGVEAYYVDDIEDKTSRTMYHLILIAMTENARRYINRIMSLANTKGRFKYAAFATSR